MKKIVLVLLFVVASVAVSFGQGRPMGSGGDKEAMREQIESLKIAHLTSVVGLTPDESVRFWPVYNKYWSDRRDNKHALHKILRGIEKDGTTAVSAKDQLSQVLQLQHAEAQLTDRLVRDLEPIIPPDKILKVFVGQESFKRVVLDKTRGGR